MMIYLGIVLVIATIYFLVKRYDARLVLLASGIIMACVAGTPMASLSAFAKNMTNGGLIQAVCSVMGFAMVMKYTECDKHLINFMASGLSKFRLFLIPGVVFATYAVNIALPSAAGTAAAAGAAAPAVATVIATATPMPMYGRMESTWERVAIDKFPEKAKSFANLLTLELKLLAFCSAALLAA